MNTEKKFEIKEETYLAETLLAESAPVLASQFQGTTCVVWNEKASVPWKECTR
jgi:hypothetical protein